MMTELLAGALMGAVLTLGLGLMVVVTGRVPARVKRVLSVVIPAEHRPLLEALWPETSIPSFDFYAQRQHYLEKLFAEQIGELRKSYPEAEIVVAVHHWEWPLVNAHHMVSEGKLYGRFELVPWDLPAAEAITRQDKRWLRRAQPRKQSRLGRNNGELPEF